MGDFVRVRSIDWTASRGVVGEVLPRVSELTDPSVANVGHLLLVFALDSPPVRQQSCSAVSNLLEFLHVSAKSRDLCSVFYYFHKENERMKPLLARANGASAHLYRHAFSPTAV